MIILFVYQKMEMVGPISISEIDLPNNAKVGDVYEKIDEEYVYNPDITSKLKEIM